MGINYITRATPPWVILLSAHCWICFYMYDELLQHHISGWTKALWWTIGYCVYGAYEVFYHHFVFHVVTLRWYPKMYHKLHGWHHKNPERSDRVCLPLAHQTLFMLVMLSIFSPIKILSGYHGYWFFAAGVVAAYSAYEVCHLYAHNHPLVSWMTFLEPAKIYHQYHHYVNHDMAFGFVSPVQDLVLECFGVNSLPRGVKGLQPFGTTTTGFWDTLARLPLPIPLYHWVVQSQSNSFAEFLKSQNYANILKQQQKWLAATDWDGTTPHAHSKQS